MFKWKAKSICTFLLHRQPKAPQQYSSLTQPITGAHFDDVLTGGEGGFLDRNRGMVAQRLSLGVLPQVVRRVRLRRSLGQQTDLDTQHLGPTRGCPVTCGVHLSSRTSLCPIWLNRNASPRPALRQIEYGLAQGERGSASWSCSGRRVS